jgi:4-amino-4-deoxy-L-arabinose transferase-like glycosyltransferase
VQFPYITDWDGWAIWGFKAKAFFIDHGFTGYLSQAQIYDFSWPARPCISSIFQAYAYLVGGQVNEAASRIVHLAGGISLLLIFYWTLRRRLSSSTAMIWTAMLATIPNLTSQATVGLGNILLAIFLFSAVSSLDRYRTEGRAGYLIAASAFLGFALLTRDEASGLCAICVAVALFFAPCPRFTSRGRMIVKTIMALAGAIILYSLWMRLIDPYHIKTLRSEWLKPGILQRAFQHLRDLEGVLALFLAQFAAPSKQTLASPLEKYLGVAFFWVIFAFVFVFSGIRSILNRRTIPIGQQNELATICGFCAALGLIAYSAGLWLFPYSSLNDLEYWCNVLNRHILSLVPLAACHIALSLSSDSSCLPKPMSARIESGNAL